MQLIQTQHLCLTHRRHQRLENPQVAMAGPASVLGRARLQCLSCTNAARLRSPVMPPSTSAPLAHGLPQHRRAVGKRRWRCGAAQSSSNGAPCCLHSCKAKWWAASCTLLCCFAAHCAWPGLLCLPLCVLECCLVTHAHSNLAVCVLPHLHFPLHVTSLTAPAESKSRKAAKHRPLCSLNSGALRPAFACCEPTLAIVAKREAPCRSTACTGEAGALEVMGAGTRLASCASS